MPVFLVTDPQGRKLRITAPEGTSEAEAVSMAQKSAGAPATGRRRSIGGALRALDPAYGIPFVKEATAALGAIPAAAVRAAKGGGFDLRAAYNRLLRRQDEEEAANRETYPVASGIGELVGGIASSAALPGGASANLAKIAGNAALYGGLKGASDVRGDRVAGALEGAASGAAGAAITGGALKLAGGALGRAARKAKPNLSVMRLAKEGVVMTPGQRRGAVPQALENAIDTIPLVRAPIRAARRRSVEQFNRAWVNTALAPIGVKLDKSAKFGEMTPQIMEKTQQYSSEAYKKALDPIKNLQLDDIYLAAQKGLEEKAASLPPAQAKAFDYIMKNKIEPLLRKSTDEGGVSGREVQAALSTLREQAAKATQSRDFADDFLADALHESHDNLTGLVGRMSPEAVDNLARANEAYGNLQRVWDAFASTGAGDKSGLVSPTRAATAAAKRGYGMTRARAAAQATPLLRLANAAKRVLPDTAPNSGTTERAIAAALLTGTIPVAPAMAVPAAATLPYYPGIDAALQRMYLARPALFGGAGRAAQRAALPAARIAGVAGANSSNSSRRNR